MSHQRVLLFAMSGRRLALPLDDVRRVAACPYLRPPVGAPGFVAGFFDFHGKPAAALRLDRLFGLEEERLGIYSPLIVLKREDPLVALHVGAVLSILVLPPSAVQAIGEKETLNACAAGRFTAGGDTAYLLAPQDLLLEEERARLAAHEAMRNERLNALETGRAHAS